MKSEKKSLIRFLLIYMGSTLFLFTLASLMFYNYEKEHLLDKQRDTLKYKSEQTKRQLRVLHNTFDKRLVYPKYDIFNSAIYDSDKQYIMGTFNQIQILGEESYYDDGKILFYVSKMEPYYLGAAYVLISTNIDTTPMVNLQKTILWFMLGAGILFGILGLFLGKLFIAPMHETVERMNRFIQDTTHELNTPISTILTNIEILETVEKYGKSQELSRIEIASQTLSRIYDDLTYLNFNHKYHRHVELLNISIIINERIVYFSAMAEVKSLEIELNIEPDIYMQIDKNDVIRMIDNLISNAIKYNKLQGLIRIILTDESLRVIDSGVGISQEDRIMILQRFKRANGSEGGFGIGLDIVNQVVMNYGFNFNIISELKKGTEMEIKWKK